jgi:hypothetical protein
MYLKTPSNRIDWIDLLDKGTRAAPSDKWVMLKLIAQPEDGTMQIVSFSSEITG